MNALFLKCLQKVAAVASDLHMKENRFLQTICIKTYIKNYSRTCMKSFSLYFKCIFWYPQVYSNKTNYKILKKWTIILKKRKIGVKKSLKTFRRFFFCSKICIIHFKWNERRLIIQEYLVRRQPPSTFWLINVWRMHKWRK